MVFEKIFTIFILIIILALTIYIAIIVNPKRNDTFSYLLDVTSTKDPITIVFEKLYKDYLNQEWPLVSTIGSIPPLLNVAYPDDSIIYYAAVFNSSNTVTLSGKIPPHIYFWSITLYDSQGLPTKSWNYKSYPTNEYTLILGPKNEVVPKGNYCVIQRAYQSISTPTIYPNYVPKISIENITTQKVTPSQRMKNSIKVQKILWSAFSLKFSSTNPKELFPTVDIHQFFLPSEAKMSSIFPNPFAKYLIVYPDTSNVIKVQGTLPSSIGYTKSISFISFMASNMNYTSTDNSIAFSNLTDSSSYTLFVAYSIEDAKMYGYNPMSDKLLLWNSKNDYPILVYRVVSPIENFSHLKNNDSTLSLFTIDNHNEDISGSVVSQQMGETYPIATTYSKEGLTYNIHPFQMY